MDSLVRQSENFNNWCKEQSRAKRKHTHLSPPGSDRNLEEGIYIHPLILFIRQFQTYLLSADHVLDAPLSAIFLS